MFLGSKCSPSVAISPPAWRLSLRGRSPLLSGKHGNGVAMTQKKRGSTILEITIFDITHGII
jgi:hypothetical protein